MDPELIVIGIVFISIGVMIGYLISTKTKLIERFIKKDREKMKVLKNPELLLEKIEEATEGRDIIDDGKRVKLSVVEEDGKKRLKVTLSDIPQKVMVQNPEQKTSKGGPKSRTKNTKALKNK